MVAVSRKITSDRNAAFNNYGVDVLGNKEKCFDGNSNSVNSNLDTLGIQFGDHGKLLVLMSEFQVVKNPWEIKCEKLRIKGFEVMEMNEIGEFIMVNCARCGKGEVIFNQTTGEIKVRKGPECKLDG